ncbi:MAG: MATE family efflux transporter [Lachnospiraceae bacterium]|nr:MATE family efflux transporter [Lachnospiraceae bacterium]
MHCKQKFDNRFLLKLVIPLVFEQLLAVSVGFVDTLMISTVGEYAISGVALVDNINRLVIQVLAAFATGGVVVVSQFIGKGSKEESRICTGQLISLMLIFTIILTVIFILFPSWILGAVFPGVEDEVMKAAIVYLVVTAYSYPFLAFYNSGAAIFRSFGNSSVSMIISIVMNAVNVVFNAIFVFGMKMGVMGVAMATLISRVAASILMFIFMSSDKNELKGNTFRDFLPKGRYILRILRIAIPSGIENGMFQVGKLLVVGMVATLGTSAIAANSVAYQIIDFPNLPASSIGIALITIVGQCIGSGDIDTAKRQITKLLKYAYISDWMSKGLLFIFAPVIVRWFSLTQQTSDIVIIVLRAFFIASIIIWPLSFTLPNALRAAGDVKYTIAVSIVSMWLCRIGASYILVNYLSMGLMGVWLGMFIDWYVRGISYGIRYLSRKWLDHSVV